MPVPKKKRAQYSRSLAETLALREMVPDGILAQFEDLIARSQQAHQAGAYATAGMTLRARRLLAAPVRQRTGFKICSRCQKKRRLSSFQHYGPGRRWVRAHCKRCALELNYEWRRNNPKLFAALQRRGRPSNAVRYQAPTRFGITPEQYDLVAVGDNGRCSICGEPEKRKDRRRLSLDHDHKTGRLRGFVCCSCNRLLGSAHDNPALLDSAAHYLRTSDLTHLLTPSKSPHFPISYAAGPMF